MAEIISKRTENSKSFDLGNGRGATDFHIGAIHYKDNYADKSELWKNIDPTIQPDGTIRKAPYDLDIDLDNMGFHCRVKKDSSEFTLQLTDIPPGLLKKVTPRIVGNRVIWENVAPDMDIVLVAGRTRVSLRRILKSEHSPTKAEFTLTRPSQSIAALRTRAWDADGKEVAVEATEVEGKLVEQINTVGKKFPIEIDPTVEVDVGASTDDCTRSLEEDAWSLTYTNLRLGSEGAGYGLIGSGLRFDNITIPNAETITTAYIIFTAGAAQSGTTCNLRVSAEKEDDPATFADDKDAFDTRFANHTTARIDWDNVAAWSLGESGADTTTPEIKTVVQEIVNRVGWASGQAMVLFVEDFDDRSSDGAQRNPAAWDNVTYDPPKLHIEYPTPQTVSPSAIASAEAFGTTKLNLTLFPSSIASSEVFGTNKLILYLLPSGIVSAEAFGTLNLMFDQTLVLGAIPSEEAFGLATFDVGKQWLYPDGIASAEAFGTAQLNLLLNLMSSGIASQEAFGTPKLNLILKPSAITSLEAFGTAKLTLYLLPSGITSLEALGSPVIAGPIIVSGIDSEESFGTPKLNLVLFPSGIVSSELFGTINIAIEQFLLPDGIASLEAFGAAEVKFLYTIIAQSIPSAESFGTAKLKLYLVCASIVSGEAFGTGKIILYLIPVAIVSEEAFGILQMNAEGRMLSVQVVTSQYRNVKVITSGG